MRIYVYIYAIANLMQNCFNNNFQLTKEYHYDCSETQIIISHCNQYGSKTAT